MALGLTIYQLVASNLPAGFSVTNNYIEERLKYWQLLLQDAADISSDDVYDLDKWAALKDGDKWLILLSYCVVYDVYVRILSGNFLSMGSSEESENSGGGNVKKIVTGPTEVEYYDSSTSLAALLKVITGPNGLFDQFLALACAFAQQLGVFLPFCSLPSRAKIIIGKRPLRGVRYFNYVIKKSSKGRL